MALNELVAIDIGSKNIKIIHVKNVKADKKLIPTIVGAKVVDSSSGGGLRFAMADLVKDLNLKKKYAVINITGRQVLVKHLTLAQPSLNPAGIKAELGKVSPVDIADLYFDSHFITDKEEQPAAPAEGAVPAPQEPAAQQQKAPPPPKKEGSDKGAALVVAAKSSAVEELYDIVKESGLIPYSVEVDAIGLMNAYDFEASNSGSSASTADKVTLLVDLGATHTLVHILADGKSKFIREVYKGGNEFTDAIEKKLGIKNSEAEEIKVNPKDRLEEVNGILGLAIEDLSHEIQMSVEFFESENEKMVDHVLLTGGAALTPGLVDSVAGATRKPASVWSPIKSLPKQLKPGEEDVIESSHVLFSVTMGLASRIID